MDFQSIVVDGSQAPAWEPVCVQGRTGRQVLTLQRHQAWPLEQPRWCSHAPAWELANKLASTSERGSQMRGLLPARRQFCYGIPRSLHPTSWDRAGGGG